MTNPKSEENQGNSSKSNKEKILIRGVNWIGDAVLTIPAIRSIRRAFPEAHISLLVKPWVAEIFTEDPDIDEIIYYDEGSKSFSGRLRLIKTLRQKRFDKAILLQNAFDAALITWLSGIPERIGYRRDCRGFLLTYPVPLNTDIKGEHQVHYYLNLIKEAGLKTVKAEPYLYLSDEERKNAKTLLNQSPVTNHPSPLIGINPGATYGSAKRWPAENFAEVIMRIVDELGGRVLIFGSASEVEIADEIVERVQRHKGTKAEADTKGIKRPSSVFNMAGKTTLRELAALISECDAFITNDSGPMHMASALHLPTLALFGSTDSTATGPLGDRHRVITKNLPCSPCLERECPEGHLRCMRDISPEEVFSALKDVLPQGKTVFLDKDGTLIKDMHYLNSFEDLKLLPGTKDNLKRLKEAGFTLVGITNQSGIARGIVDEEFVKELNAYLQKELGIDDFYYCPHHPDEECPCRKPELMLILKARLKHGTNLKASYVIGDKESDVMLAKRTGAEGILLAPVLYPQDTSASYIAKNLEDAVNWIMEREKED